MLNKALEAYLGHLSQHLPTATVASHRSTLTEFVEESQRRGITISELNICWAEEYLTKTSSNYRPATVQGKISTIANFVAYVTDEDPELIREQLQTRLAQRDIDATLTEGDACIDPVNDELQIDIKKCLEYVRSKNYGTRVHAVIEICIATGCRLASLRALNVEDLNLDTREIELSISEKHAVSQTDLLTSRTVTLPEHTVRAVRTYMKYERIPDSSTDASEPLFTTHHGRVSAATLRRSMQAIIDAANSDSSGDDSTGTNVQEDTSDGRVELTPSNIRRYYIAQLTEK